MISHLTLSETDTFDEVNKAINMLIDNLNLVEVKVLSIDKNKPTKGWVKKLLQPKKKKGGEQ